MRTPIVAAALVFAAVPAAGQTAGPCSGVPSGSNCVNVLQAITSAVPQYGIVTAAGSAVPGVEGTRGLTFGIIPHTTASLRVSSALVNLPKLDDPSRERSSVPAEVRLGTATQVFGGTAMGTGALELLLEAGVFGGGKTASVLGAGARLGLLRETFATPGVAVSGVYRHTSPLRYGKVCVGLPGCGVGAGDQADFGLNDVSLRLTVGKRVGPVGLLGGAGWDRFAAEDGSITYSGNDGFEPLTGTRAVSPRESRWSAFANVSKNILIGSAIAEAGWMSGGKAVAGYAPGANGYDPGRGTFFGSLALRFQL
jgi:hypothetical protein